MNNAMELISKNSLLKKIDGYEHTHLIHPSEYHIFSDLKELIIQQPSHSLTYERGQTYDDLLNKDPLTHVKSKYFYSAVVDRINFEIETGVAKKFAVAMFDVNGLKYINDTYGHNKGDEYLCRAAKLICNTFKHSPVFRIGGDEFVVISIDYDYRHRDELMQTLHNISVINIVSNDVVISGGISEYIPETDTCFNDVFNRADRYMYNDKELLKNMGAITREDF